MDKPKQNKYRGPTRTTSEQLERLARLMSRLNQQRLVEAVGQAAKPAPASA
jgi:hypothetical protein